MNTKLLRRVAKHISEEPKRLQMAWWITRKSAVTPKVNEYGREFDFAKCDTAACIAGWSVLLSGYKPKNSSGVPDKARELLRLKNGEQSQRLFGVAWWPSKFGNAYRRAMRPETRARIAVARIEHFIKTKGAE